MAKPALGPAKPDPWDPARAAPAVQRAPSQVGEAAGGTPLRQARPFGRGQVGGDGADQALVAREAEHIGDAVRLAPSHQGVAGKARIGAQEDLHPRPPGPDLGYDAFDLVDRAGRRIDVRAPELGREQVPAAEHVQRQIAVAIPPVGPLARRRTGSVTVEEAAFLMPMPRVVGGIEVENDLFGWRPVRFEKESDEQPLDRRAVMADLVVTARSKRRMLEPVERALAGERGAIVALGGELAGERREHRVVPQVIVVDQIFVAERDAEHPLRYHRLDAVLDLRLDATVGKTGGEPPDQTDRPIGRAEQQPAGVRGGVAAIECGHDLAALDHFITEQVAATLCRHRGAPLRQPKPL